MKKEQKKGQSAHVSHLSKEVPKSRHRMLLRTFYQSEAVIKPHLATGGTMFVLENDKAVYEVGISLLWKRRQKSTTTLFLSLVMTLFLFCLNTFYQ